MDTTASVGNVQRDANCMNHGPRLNDIPTDLNEGLENMDGKQHDSGSNNANGQIGNDICKANDGSSSGQPMLDDFGQNSGSNNEQPRIGSDNGNASGATASIPQQDNDIALKISTTIGRDFGSKFKGKQSFASLFKENRVPSDESKLHFVRPSTLGELEFVIEDIDLVEKSFGFCLVGYVMDRDQVLIRSRTSSKDGGKVLNSRSSKMGGFVFNSQLRLVGMQYFTGDRT